MPEGYSKHVSRDEYRRGEYGPATQRILRANLECALSQAIDNQREHGQGTSAQVAGYREVLIALRAGYRIEVVDD